MTAPTVAVVDYGIGNIRSAERALARCGARTVLTGDPAEVAAADAVVLPGVGAFGACIGALRSTALDAVVLDAISSGRPFLGICVGMQMLFTASEEDGCRARGLDVIPGVVRWLPATEPRPQMQWNRVRPRLAADPLFDGLGARPWMYFVHSLHGVPDDPDVIAATCEYGTEITAAVRIGNVVATQFHPEKSGSSGLALLSNFVREAARAVAAT